MAYENAKHGTRRLRGRRAIDFLRYYSSELERNGDTPPTHEPTPGQRCVSDLQPCSVFGVMAPFNFPFAITVGMTTGALIRKHRSREAGEHHAADGARSTTPSRRRAFRTASSTLVTGGGRAVGQPMIEHEDVAGFVFTGSREVGLGSSGPSTSWANAGQSSRSSAGRTRSSSPTAPMSRRPSLA